MPAARYIFRAFQRLNQTVRAVKRTIWAKHPPISHRIAIMKGETYIGSSAGKSGDVYEKTKYSCNLDPCLSHRTGAVSVFLYPAGCDGKYRGERLVFRRGAAFDAAWLLCVVFSGEEEMRDQMLFLITKFSSPIPSSSTVCFFRILYPYFSKKPFAVMDACTSISVHPSERA